MSSLVILPVKNEPVPRIVDYDVLVIDSGKQLGYNGDNITRVKIDLNIPDAVLFGIDYAFLNGYDSVVFIDGGGRYPQSDITKVLEQLKGCDVAIGSRFLPDSVNNELFSRNLIRRVIREVFNWLLWDYTNNLKDWTHAFRAYKLITLLPLRSELKQLNFKTGQGVHLWLLVKLILEGKYVKEVPIHYTKSVGKIKKGKILEVLRVLGYGYRASSLPRV